MATREFRSKIDGWLLLVLLAGCVMAVAGLAVALYQGPFGAQLVLVIIAVLLALALILSVLLHTLYRVDARTLTVISGPFRWRIPVAEIESVRPTRNPLSSPALSLDRLRIEYSGGKRMLVSPADKAGFMKAIGFHGDGGRGG